MENIYIILSDNKSEVMAKQFSRELFFLMRPPSERGGHNQYTLLGTAQLGEVSALIIDPTMNIKIHTDNRGVVKNLGYLNSFGVDANYVKSKINPDGIINIMDLLPPNIETHTYDEMVALGWFQDE